jgi:tetratricopeptide (TPR) repeat protein
MADDGLPRPLPALRFAGKLEQLKAGEHVAVSPTGAVIGAAAIRRRRVLYSGWLATLCISAVWINPVFGAIYTVGVGALVGTRIARLRTFNRIPRLLMEDRLDEAERELDLADRRSLRPSWRGALASWRAALCWRRGDLEAALTAARRCLELLPAPSRGHANIYWQNQLALSNLLLALGRADEAAPFIAQALKAPAGEWYRVQQRALEAHRAFALGKDHELGSDDDLHDRVREGLRYNHTGMMLGALAWAYAQRGDDDMAAHLVAEVPSRLLFSTVEAHARMYPRLWAWLEPRIPAPDADAEDDL